MNNDPNYFLGRVLRKIADAHELEVRLEFLKGEDRYLTISKYEVYQGGLKMIGWASLYADNLEQLQLALRKAYAIATALENEDQANIEFSCALDGEEWAFSTKQLRVILEVTEGTKVLNLITYRRVKSNWCPDQASSDCELGMDDLRDIIEALEVGAAGEGKETPLHQDEENSNG